MAPDPAFPSYPLPDPGDPLAVDFPAGEPPAPEAGFPRLYEAFDRDLVEAGEELAAMLRDRAFSAYARRVLLRPEEVAALGRFEAAARRVRGLED